MMKQDSNPTTTTNNHPTLATVCGQCGVEERKLLHNVRLRGNFRRLCTTCVLRLHPQCFCPACLGVYERLPPDDAVVCYKCYSASHPSCVSLPPAGTIASSRGPSPCSSCLNPNLLVLNLNRLENGSRTGGRVIDGNSARLLLAAGKIAAMSMSKAEVAAAMEAERRSKEAAYTKKRAREALDHVVRLMGKEKKNVVESNNRKVCNVNNSVVSAVPVVVDGNVVNRIDDSNEVLKASPLAVDGPNVVNRVDDSKDVLKALPVVVADGNVVNRVDDSNEVLKALNAVDLKDDGAMVAVPVQGVSIEKVVSELQGDGVVMMEVDVGKDSGFNSVAKNGSVTKGDLVKIGPDDQEQALVESSVSNL